MRPFREADLISCPLISSFDLVSFSWPCGRVYHRARGSRREWNLNVSVRAPLAAGSNTSPVERDRQLALAAEAVSQAIGTVPERWATIEWPYHEALERGVDERAAFLAETARCVRTRGLASVDLTLRAHGQGRGFQFKISRMGASASRTTAFIRNRCPSADTTYWGPGPPTEPTFAVKSGTGVSTLRDRLSAPIWSRADVSFPSSAM